MGGPGGGHVEGTLGIQVLAALPRREVHGCAGQAVLITASGQDKAARAAGAKVCFSSRWIERCPVLTQRTVRPEGGVIVACWVCISPFAHPTACHYGINMAQALSKPPSLHPFLTSLHPPSLTFIPSLLDVPGTFVHCPKEGHSSCAHLPGKQCTAIMELPRGFWEWFSPLDVVVRSCEP